MSPLLYLPGIEGTGRLLYRQTALLDGCDVRCASYPQDRPQTYLSLAEDAARMIEQAGRPAIVLAESFGGGVALTLALERPELVERLMLVNTFARFPRRWLIRAAALLSRLAPRRSSPPWSRRFRERFFFSPEVPRDVRDEWWTRVGDVPLRAYAYRLPLIAGLDLRPRLPEIRIPTLVLAAPDDRVVPPSAGRELARAIPGAKLLEQSTGHAALVHPAVNVASWLS